MNRIAHYTDCKIEALNQIKENSWNYRNVEELVLDQ